LTTAGAGNAEACRLVRDCASPASTRKLAGQLGRLAFGGLVIALTGDLGSGKTTFIQGLASGLGVAPECYVTSPSFALVNDYPGRLPLYHADLYRLGEAADIEALGLLEYMGGEGVVAVEWAEHAEADLPPYHLAVHLEITGKGRRRVTLTAYGLEVRNLLTKLADAPEGDPPGA
jgi:tRNA threonylcarbamoyladenosine biosynthesis protein TsaE